MYHSAVALVVTEGQTFISIRPGCHAMCVRLWMYVCVVLHVGSCGLEGPCCWPVGEGEVQTYFNIIVPWNMHEHTHIEETLQHCGFSFFTSSNIGKPPRFKLTFPVPPRPSALSTSLKQDVTSQGVYPDTTNFKYLYYSWIFPFYVSFFFLNFWLAHRLTTDWLLHIAHASCNDDFTST